MKIAYVAMGNKDTIEGKGPMIPIAAFWDKGVAEEVSASEGGCMGQRQKPWVNEMPIFESIQDREEWTKGKKKREALAKLTEEDKYILGLKN